MEQRVLDLLRLTLADGIGPVLLSRLLMHFGSPEAVLAATPLQLERVKGVGSARSRAIATAAADAHNLVDRELEEVSRHGVTVVALGSEEYPQPLSQIPDPPPLLYVRGKLDPNTLDRYCVAIVGSRGCTHYGLEQAGRFGGGLAEAGLTVVSGGARGIDTAAHRGALTAGGRTIAVLGCGLASSYPPENGALFDRIVSDERGAVVSELPMTTPPKAENFPARNRIISGLSLGVLVVEAGRQSGSLITARLAGEEHGREVMALPGRVDSPSSLGTNDLIRLDGAALVTQPGDVLDVLHAPGRRHHDGAEVSLWKAADPVAEQALEPLDEPGLTDTQRRVLDAMGDRGESATIEHLVERTGLAIPTLRAELTVLELRRSIRRAGSRFERAR